MAQYGMLVQRSKGWEPLVDTNNQPMRVSNPVDLFNTVKDGQPKAKMILFEYLEFTVDPFTFAGGSASPDVALEESVSIVTGPPTE